MDIQVSNEKIIFFTERYCGTCSIVNNNLIEEVLSYENEFKCKIQRITLSQNKALARELGVTDAPTIIFPNNERIVGYCTREEIRKVLRNMKH